MSQNPAFDSSIPVLTEVVLEPLVVEPVPPPATQPAPAEPVVETQAIAEPIPALEPAAASEAAPPAAPVAVAEPIAAAQPAAPAPAAAPSTPVEPDWDELERRIAARVVQQLRPQIDAIVRGALLTAHEQIQAGVRQAVEQVVAQQVASVQFAQK